MRLGQDVLADPVLAHAVEWLLANGIGGSASGSALGAGARRSHAWLTAAGEHGGPIALLLGFAERLRGEAGAFDLGIAPVGVGPKPASCLVPETFTLDPLPSWSYLTGGTRLERSLFLISGHHAVVVRWRHLEGPPVTLTVSPLVVARAPLALQSQNDGFRGAAQSVPGRVRIEMPGPLGPLTLWHNGAFMPARVWRAVEHAAEAPAERGEEAFVPGYVEATLGPGATLAVVAATREDLFRTLAREDRLGSPPPKTLTECAGELERRERNERQRWTRLALVGADQTAHQAATARGDEEAGAEPASRLDASDGWTAALADTLLRGLVRRGARLTAVASLPRAEECGTTALRAVAGLLAIRAFEPAREILRGYAEFLDEGVAPESFDPADGTPRYGDPGPSLWLIHAGELYARRSGDLEFARSVLHPACESIVHFFRSGTRHGIRVDQDGLLQQGADGVKLAGVNAAWSHALVAMAQLSRLVGRKESGAFHLAWARDHQQAFAERFVDPASGIPYVRIERGAAVAGVAPALLLAASLTPPLLPPEALATLVDVVERELATPWGLRAAPGAPLVSPAWLGPFASATLRARGRDPGTVARVRGWFDSLLAARLRGVPDSLPERFDLADTDARGLPAPAGEPVSVLASAELLRAWVEDVEHESAPVETALE